MEKREQKQLSEAVTIFKNYYECYGETPDKSVFHEYFYLFCKPEDLTELYRGKMQENGNFQECMHYLESHAPMFENYEAFCEYAMNLQL